MTLMTIKDILCAVNKACLIEIFINKIITQLIIYAYSSY